MSEPKKNYWSILPTFLADTKNRSFEDIWSFDVKNSKIAISYPKVGDMSGMEKNDAKKYYIESYPDHKPSTLDRDFNLLWNFYNDIKIDDIIIAKRNPRLIIGYGIVIKNAYYDPDKSVERMGNKKYSHFLDVKWVKIGELILEKNPMSPIFIQRHDESYFQSLDIDKLGEITEDSVSIQFSLEKKMEYFMIRNFDKIFKGELEIYYDAETGKNGNQFHTSAGFIDILATDKKTGDFVVIELKRGRESRDVAGQITSYMGWVKQHLCNSGQKVKGIIVVGESSIKLNYAIDVIPNVRLMEYSVQFKFVK